MAVYSDSPSDLPCFAGTRRPVLVNADEKAAAQVTRVRQILEGLSLQVATPAEARQILQLKGGDAVAF